MAPVIYERRGPIGHITLNRPERLNAIDEPLLDAFNAALDAAARDDGVAVILLAAAGRAFCAGDDLVDFAQSAENEDKARRFVGKLQDVSRKMMLGTKPVVCAAQGWIVGGGAAWPLNADFTVFGEDAVMFCPEAGYGLFPSGGATILLAERCGPENAARILWLGERTAAARLLELGLAGELAGRDELLERAEALATRLAALPATSRARYKEARRRDLADRLERALAYEAECCVQAAMDPDVRARVEAAISPA